jgi:ABC-type proline/glycine betaine transport system permease subunit
VTLKSLAPSQLLALALFLAYCLASPFVKVSYKKATASVQAAMNSGVASFPSVAFIELIIPSVKSGYCSGCKLKPACFLMILWKWKSMVCKVSALSANFFKNSTRAIGCLPVKKLASLNKEMLAGKTYWV